MSNSLELSKDLSLFDEIIKLEYSFSVLQTNKILKHLGIGSLKNLLNKDKNCLKQKTSILSYFVLKTLMLNDSNYWIKKKKSGWWKCCSSKEWIAWIDHSLKNKDIYKHLDGNVEELYPTSSCKMSCIDIKTKFQA